MGDGFYRRRNQASKRHRQQVTAAVRAIREDDDPLTHRVKCILSARRMARAEYEGVEFTMSATDHERGAMLTFARLWPRKANGMLRRLRLAGIYVAEVVE